MLSFTYHHSALHQLLLLSPIKCCNKSPIIPFKSCDWIREYQSLSVQHEPHTSFPQQPAVRSTPAYLISTVTLGIQQDSPASGSHSARYKKASHVASQCSPIALLLSAANCCCCLKLLLARQVRWHCRHTATLLSAPPDRTVTCNIAKHTRWGPALRAKAAEVIPILTR